MGKVDRATIGGRVRALRLERGWSQAELAAAFPGKRTQAWVSSVETGRQGLSREDAGPLALILGVTEGYLVTGDQGIDSTFIARLRGLEPLLDFRAQRVVISVAEQQAREADERERAIRRLLDDPEVSARYEALLEEARSTLPGLAARTEEEAGQAARGQAEA